MTADPTSSRAAWLAERRKGLGSSDIAAILGIKGSRMAVWASKVLEPTPGPERFDERMAWGKFLERAIAEGYASLRGVRIQWFGEVVMRHPSIEWWAASPDAAVVRELQGVRPNEADARPMTAIYSRGLEVKNRDRSQEWKWGEDGTDAVPEDVGIQVFHQMPVLDVETSDVVALFGGNEARVYTLARDRSVEELIADEGEKFWRNHVLTGIPPEVDGSEDARRAILRRFPRNIVNIREATVDEAATLEAFVAAWHGERRAKAELALRGNQARELIGQHAGIRWSEEGKCLSWKKNKDGKWCDLERVILDLAEELTGSPLLAPKVVEERKVKFTSPTTGARVLRLNKAAKGAVEEEEDEGGE